MEKIVDYRIIAQKDNLDNIFFEIRTVYYNKNGKPDRYDVDASVVFGYDIEDLMFTVNEFKRALNMPILWGNDRFPEQFDYDKWIKNKKL